MKSLILLCLSCLILCCTAEVLRAYAPFKKPFEEKYVTDTANPEFQAEFKKAGCNVCHVKDKPKDWLNAYGLELAKHIPGNAKERLEQAKAESRDAYKAENERLLEELKEALLKAEPSKAPDGVTYGERLKSQQLPREHGARSLYEKEEGI